MKDFCIIGSGISGATIANSLSKKYSLDVYDKARGVGGRSSNKKLNKNESFDHGVQYISPKSIQFKKFIKSLISKKIVKKWTGKHLFLNTDKKEDKKHIKIIGKKGNNAISKYLLKDINCNFNSEVVKIFKKNKVWEIYFSDGSKKLYKSLILTCPFPQLKKLSKKYIKHSFNIQGSSYSGIASINNVVGNWWSHKILQTDSQISPISGSIKEQVVTFVAKEKIELYGKTYDVDHFKLTSKDMSLPKDKRLNFDIWFDKKNSLILKVTYSRLGNWEYKVKKVE